MKYLHKLKYAAIILLVAIQLHACQSSANKENKSQTEQTPKPDTDDEHEHPAATKLALNNGAKWNADSSTNKNVSALLNIVEQIKPSSLEDYHHTSQNLQEGIHKMINECRMKGPDHDALHHWLEPLMEENKKLAASGSVAEAAEALKKIKIQIDFYTQFFNQ
ncbi:hypothetical protein BH11BAC3_BH11BAC3_39190 [soil metagenome]